MTGTWAWPHEDHAGAIVSDVEKFLRRLYVGGARLFDFRRPRPYEGHICGGPLNGAPCTFLDDLNIDTIELRLRADLVADLGEDLVGLAGRRVLVMPDAALLPGDLRTRPLRLAERPPPNVDDFIELALCGVMHTNLGPMYHEFPWGRGAAAPELIGIWGWYGYGTRCRLVTPEREIEWKIGSVRVGEP